VEGGGSRMSEDRDTGRKTEPDMRYVRHSTRLLAFGALLLFALVFLYSIPAYAYIDPGTGSALIYIVTGILVSAYFAVRGLYFKIIEFVFRVRFKNQKCNVAIHSEDPRYESTFMPVIRALAERKVEITFFTMYERGDSFEPLPSQVTHQSIPQGLVGYSYLNNLDAKMLVTTTPQLDVMTFRRSKKVKHYCHIPHALGESRFVRPFAYDFFDSVFCCGKLLEENIRIIESIRKFQPKQLFKTGIPHYDELVREVRDARRDDTGKTVLIAPSWGPLSLFEVFGTGFVREVAERYKVIVRPHPQMRISQVDLYKEILEMKGVVVDSSSGPSEAMSRADILISDISGIVYEFAFIYERPVIVVDHTASVDGLEGHFLRDVVTLRERCADFIVGLPQSEMSKLVKTIGTVLEQDLPKHIVEARGELIYNFGDAGSVAAEQIEDILRCI
jgi:hypothetical protein